MLKDLNQTWDLEVFFPGGSRSAEFAEFVDLLEKDIAAISTEVAGGEAGATDAWARRLERVQDATRRLRHAESFVSCLTSQDVGDKYARLMENRVRQVGSSLAAVMTALDKQFLDIPDAEWRQMLDSEALRPLAFNLDERRSRAKEMLPPELETLANALSVDGYDGWSDLYNLVTGRMTITIEEDGRPITLSPGQVANRMSNPDPALRAHIMSRWEEAWAREADMCALALNRLAGFRLALYGKRGWESVLKEPLEINRMSAETLDAMWDAINRNKDRLVAYMQRKKKVLGLDKFGWQDVEAPLGKAGGKMSYDQAAAFIVEQFGRHSPAMAQFATKAFRERWIEAEDRPGKRMGGFCTGFPCRQQSRIFVTFSGTLPNTATVAHELGHGYHGSLMWDLPPMTQRYAMNVAETASTFAEMIVADAAVTHAKDKQERLVLIEDKLRRAVSLLNNIQARFLFETRFYKARKKGTVSVEHLNDLMVEAQREAFAGALDLYHPHFWASKPHFYITRTPFYNFPYTFGYLFSAGVYSRAREVGPGFEARYRELLRDTGRMRVEDLGKRHLDVDLRKPDFWQSALDSVLADLPEFMELTK